MVLPIPQVGLGLTYNWWAEPAKGGGMQDKIG